MKIKLQVERLYYKPEFSTVFLSIMNQTAFRFIHKKEENCHCGLIPFINLKVISNQKENCHCGHIPLNYLKGTTNLFHQSVVRSVRSFFRYSLLDRVQNKAASGTFPVEQLAVKKKVELNPT